MCIRDSLPVDDSLANIMALGGAFVCHEGQPEDIGHYLVVAFRSDQVTIVDDIALGFEFTTSAEAFCTEHEAGSQITFFRLILNGTPGVIAAAASHPASMLRGHGDSDDDMEQYLLSLCKRERDEYETQISAYGYRPPFMRCKLCPARTFGRKDQLLDHQKHH
eukprot:15068-Karenia_brevis.AAC.1